MLSLYDPNCVENSCRRKESPQARAWVEAHHGHWDHDDWIALIEDLQKSESAPDLAATGEALEEYKKEYWNLNRWKDSGQPRAWVEMHQGQWSHEDWLALLETLKDSSFHPLDPRAVGQVLEEMKRECHNLRSWQGSGLPALWVEAHQGQWNHADWLALLDTLQASEFWPLDPAVVARVLETRKAQWWNLKHWQESGRAYGWVEAQRGQWDHAGWLALVETLTTSEFWPLDLEAVAGVLEELKRQYWNLQQWQRCGRAEQWLSEQQGHWHHADWLALVARLQQSEFWPLQPAAVGRLVERLRSERVNLRRWEEAGEARRWVEAHPYGWNHGDWLELLGDLETSGFWPLQPDAVGLVLEQTRKRLADGRRWHAAAPFPSSAEAHAERWEHGDWLLLLQTLENSLFWPIDLAAVGKVVEELQSTTQLAA